VHIFSLCCGRYRPCKVEIVVSRPPAGQATAGNTAMAPPVDSLPCSLLSALCRLCSQAITMMRAAVSIQRKYPDSEMLPGVCQQVVLCSQQVVLCSQQVVL
jgi:hypothetical protein